MMGRFDGKVALITGAASGFGKLLAEAMAEEGALLVMGDRNKWGLRHVARGHVATYMRCDVTREDKVQALSDLAIEQFGRLDIAVNNAGLAGPMKPLTEIREDEFDLIHAVNAKGVFFGLKHQIPLMRADGGTILNVASVAGLGAAPKLAAYAAAKHAVVGLTKTAAIEEARNNIRVNAICPFYSDTPMVTQGAMADKQDFLAQASPMKRLGTAQEVVATMLALLDPANSYLTGQAIAVDGGVTAY
ncbi:SDR family NAD(P)-dependent oxidoreductase [Nioella nitratireducens]|uniref:SDR family NAD(P)-dependent oxidoreductase n=1 Tax=Nioella nitratireducens TaxID=1287720 RepID=UPI0008FD69F2|nr:glucose 1-dehydrogenase [Nioella nitratireducens]